MSEYLPDKIVGLDQIRINRSLQKICKCEKRKFVMDTTNRRVTCNGCGAVVDPYEALLEIATNDERRTEQVKHLLEQQKQVMNYKPHLKVFKNLEQQYKRKKLKEREMLPCCPECDSPFYFEHINFWINRELVTVRRKREGKPFIE